jgi:hypothetical protein
MVMEEQIELIAYKNAEKLFKIRAKLGKSVRDIRGFELFLV